MEHVAEALAGVLDVEMLMVSVSTCSFAVEKVRFFVVPPLLSETWNFTVPAFDVVPLAIILTVLSKPEKGTASSINCEAPLLGL